MNPPIDRSDAPLLVLLGGRAGTRWQLGFDEPRLRDALFGAWRPGAAPEPRTFAGRASRWLFEYGGMSLVLVAGLIVLGLLGGVFVGR